MKKLIFNKISNIGLFITILLSLIVLTTNTTYAGSYDGEDLALAILQNATTLIDSSYTDKDPGGHRQAVVLSSLGTLQPTDGIRTLTVS